MNLFKSNFLGSSWKTWFHSGDHTQNLKMPENFIPCNYKNRSKINLPLSSSPIPRRPWMNGNPKEAIPEVTPGPKPWLWPSPKFSGPSGVPSPLKQAHKYYLPLSTHQHLVLQMQELLLYVPIPSLSSSPSLLLFSHCHFLGRSRIQNELGVLALEK